MLVSLIFGLFCAAAATRVAWETSRPQPDRAEVAAIFGHALPDHPLPKVKVPPALFVSYDEAVGWGDLGTLLRDAGAEYGLGTTDAWLTGVPPVSQEYTLTLAVERLRADGWYVYEPFVRPEFTCSDPNCDFNKPRTTTTLIAYRGDTSLRLKLHSEDTMDSVYLALTLSRRTPPAAYPAGVAGGLVGFVLAWFVFAWASRRTDQPAVARAAANTLCIVTVSLWWLPVPPIVVGQIVHLLIEPHPDWPPLWEWLGQPGFSTIFVTGCITAFSGLAVAALSRPWWRASGGRVADDLAHGPQTRL